MNIVQLLNKMSSVLDANKDDCTTGAVIRYVYLCQPDALAGCGTYRLGRGMYTAGSTKRITADPKTNLLFYMHCAACDAVFAAVKKQFTQLFGEEKSSCYQGDSCIMIDIMYRTIMYSESTPSNLLAARYLLRPTEYIYLLRHSPRATLHSPFATADMYKVGRSSRRNYDRFKEYHNTCILLMQICCENSVMMESRIVAQFDIMFNAVEYIDRNGKTRRAREYFFGHPVQMMQIIYNTIKNENDCLFSVPLVTDTTMDTT